MGISQSGYPDHYFMAYIVQDGNILPIDQHVVKVKRAPFQVVIDMPDRKGVFVNASLNKATYKSALRNVEWQNLKGFGFPAMFELWSNPFQEILLSETQPMYWFITSKLHNRFTSYEYINNRFLCIRDVCELYDTDAHELIPLKNIETAVYITFIKYSTENENFRETELMRHEFKIEWVD